MVTVPAVTTFTVVPVTVTETSRLSYVHAPGLSEVGGVREKEAP